MTEHEPLTVKVAEARLLTTEEKILLEELKTFQKSTIDNIRAAFQQLITLSVTLIGLQIGILEFISFQPATFQTAKNWLILLSFSLLFAVVVISFIGQTSGVLHLSTIDTLTQYRTFREKRVKRSYPLYISANLLFIGGLASFIIGFVFIQ